MVIVTDRVPKIGEILMKDGAVDRVQIELALEEQRKTGKPLGEILVARGYITRKQLRRSLLEQFRLQVTAGVVSVALAFGAPLQALADSSATLALRGVVPPMASVELSHSEARIPGDLRIPHSGEIVTLMEKSNVPFGYKVIVKSDTAARHSVPVLENLQSQQIVPYRLNYGGKDVIFRNGEGLLTDSSRPAPRGVEKKLSVKTDPSGELQSGTYSDLLTLSIIYKK